MLHWINSVSVGYGITVNERLWIIGTEMAHLWKEVGLVLWKTLKINSDSKI